ncbi:hypothetical protein [Leptolyngbya sp. CCY15150]|nr:hypothetical protein [Leptolyngbya sp. CCY15150]
MDGNNYVPYRSTGKDAPLGLSHAAEGTGRSRDRTLDCHLGAIAVVLRAD